MRKKYILKIDYKNTVEATEYLKFYSKINAVETAKLAVEDTRVECCTVTDADTHEVYFRTFAQKKS